MLRLPTPQSLFCLDRPLERHLTTLSILEVEIDSKLTFNKQIEMLCSRVNKKVSAFAKLNNYTSR